MGRPRHKAEVLRLEDGHSALELKKQYPYALLYCYSEVVLCETSELTDKVWDECREARFFGQEAELHIFPDEEEQSWSQITKTPTVRIFISSIDHLN